MTTESYVNFAEQLSAPSQIALPVRIETLLEKIYGKHNGPPVNVDTRRRLSSIPEELALETLRKVYNAPHVKSTLDGFILHLVNSATVNGSPRPSPGESPIQSPRTQGNKFSRAYQAEMSLDSEAPSPKVSRREESLHSPQLLALGELEFNKAFLLLSYIPGKSLAEVITADEIREWKYLPMAAYETAVWSRFGQDCPQKEPRVPLEWNSTKTHYYQCHVAPDGTYRFKGPIVENTGTHLHKVLGDENVLTVKFADVPGNESYSTYKGIARNGIMVGLRRYQFFVFKSGGKEEKKKKKSTKGVKCYFIRTDSTTSNDMGNTYIFSGKSIHEARMHFMHVNRLPSLAKYMARFSLILSKTKTLEADMTGINFDIIEDIRCHDQYNKEVLDKDDKPRIHSDGTGYISEDLARLCPTDIFKGKSIKSYNIQIPNFEAHGTCGQEPPLLIQFRMFFEGYAVKGTFLLNKNLPPRTVQVRPSMIKVDKDPNLSNFSTFNSLEVVTTSNPPKKAKLSRNLVALLSYGGVPNDFFLNILRDTLEKSKTIFQNKNAAIKAACNYGETDDCNVLEMLGAGIPLDEPYLKHRLASLLNTQKNNLKAGRLPVKESYYLMGTVYPTKELKENEVCVILKDGQISGDVLVYRNPGLHFGDIHVLKATYVEALEEYVGNSKYGVFFPQKGPRSLGDEIAGGDFDGDMYFISRNPELLEHFKPSEEKWVSLTPPSKSNSGRKPNQLSPQELEEELFDMFLKARFQASNVIGMAADSWLTVMDRFLTLGDYRAKEKAEMEEKMLRLIDIYYDALDAPKNGAKVHLPDELRPDIFPHYMERENKFNSTSVLGLIYDFVESHTTEETTPSSEISKLSYFKDEPVSEHIMDKYRGLYENYSAEMSQAMKTKGSNKDGIIERYKQEFYGAASFEDSKKNREELYAQALALYNIVYDYAIQTRSVSECGFVWKVAGPVLCDFYVKKIKQEKCMVFSHTVLKELLG